MRKEKHSGSLGKERHKKEKVTSVTRAISWLSGSSLSRQTRRLFRSHSDLNAVSRTSHRDQENDEDDDDDAWVYEPQHSIAVSNLDEESKWTVHYTAPWHQQENVFLPASRPTCLEELHCQAKVNLKTSLRDCDKLRKDGFRSSQYYSQGPTFSGSAHSRISQLEDEDEDDVDDKSNASSAEEYKSSSAMKAHAAVKSVGTEVDGQESGFTPLPTPEEKMRQQAQAILTDIVPINVTGETFDRQASIRRSLLNTDTLARRPQKVKRRKTISGVPDNVRQELAKARGAVLRPQSMFIPGQFSTLERSSSVSSTHRHSGKRDSGCQTEEVKIVPPSVRRIRAQRGQGIAAQISGMSTSATNISTVPNNHTSGSSVHVISSRFNGDPQRFHSLPRGARVSLNTELPNSSTSCRPEDSAVPASRQIGKFQVDDTAVHMRNAPRTSTLGRPKSQEVRGSHGDWGNACVVSPHSAYSTSLIPNATLSRSAEVFALHSTSTPGQQMHSRPLRISGVNGESSTSVATSAGTEETDMQETSQSDSSLNSQSTLAAGTASSDEQWIYDTPENALSRRPLTSSCSTPINHLYNSLERASKCTDSSSLYSMDNDGYYTSMHLDSGLRPKGHSNAGRTRHSMYECIGQPGDRSSIYSNQSLSRSISLRKSKKPPLPPTRTDSLQRKPKNKNSGNASNKSILNESLIATLQQSLQNGLKGKGSLTSPSQSPCSDYEDPWLLRPRSQSSLSAGSSSVSAAGMANVYSICPITPSHSETSSLRSDYAESWGYYMEYPRHHDRSQSLGHTNSVSNEGHPGIMTNGQHVHNDSQTTLPPAQGDVPSKPQVSTSSPDRVHRLTSPSSGYSSQSNTPTAGTPVPTFMRSMSPSGSRPKPRVPERKSSLLSSVSISSSSTSLSSNTSDSVRNNIPLPPPPQPHSSVSLKLVTLEPFPPPLPPSETFPPPPAPPLPSTPECKISLSPLSIDSSPEFPPPPPPEVLNDHSMLNNGSFSPTLHPTLPPPPPLFHPNISTSTPPQPPSLPTLTPIIPSSASLKGIKDRLRSVNSERRSVSIHSEELCKSAMPLITPFTLQSVQLRSVKQPANVEESNKSHEVENEEIPSKSDAAKEVKQLAHPIVLPLASCSSSDIHGTLESPSTMTIIAKPENQAEMPLNKAQLRKDITYELNNCPSSDLVSHTLNKNEVKEEKSPQITTPKKKPPVFPKKSKFPLFSVIDAEIVENKHTVEEEHYSSFQEFANVQREVTIHRPKLEVQESVEGMEKKDDNISTDSFTCESSTYPRDNQVEECAETPIIKEASVSVDDVMDTLEGEADGDGDDDDDDDDDALSSTAGSVCSKEDGEVFESSTSNSPQTSSINGDIVQDMVTPTRPRTTEDLFAVIHRSKRKVLGRRESDDERVRGQSSPPATPTGPNPSLSAALPRQTGSIQRSLRKSATSSDTFKALLLKKGSRSEGSFRMSATEMLRTTDPRFQKTRSVDSPLDLASHATGPDSPCGSPGHSKRASEDWPRNEAIQPRYSQCSPLSPSSMLGLKYGRSRTPPSAASSKYNSRSRIPSSPMTVICEREGELTESGEGLDEPRPDSSLVSSTSIPQKSNGTLCEGDS